MLCCYWSRKGMWLSGEQWWVCWLSTSLRHWWVALPWTFVASCLLFSLAKTSDLCHGCCLWDSDSSLSPLVPCKSPCSTKSYSWIAFRGRALLRGCRHNFRDAESLQEKSSNLVTSLLCVFGTGWYDPWRRTLSLRVQAEHLRLSAAAHAKESWLHINT